MGDIKKIGVGVGVMIINDKNQLLLGLRNPKKEKKSFFKRLFGRK